jgi:hypothetical protein
MTTLQTRRIVTAQCDPTIADCTVVDATQADTICLCDPSAAETITFYGAARSDSPFRPIKDTSGDVVTLAIDNAHQHTLPAAVLAFPYLKLKTASSDITVAVVLRDVH